MKTTASLGTGPVVLIALSLGQASATAEDPLPPSHYKEAPML